MFQAAFITSQGGERMGTGAIELEGSGQAVGWIGEGRRGRRVARPGFVILGLIGVLLQAGVVIGGDLDQKLAVDTGFEEEGAVEAPLIGGDAHDEGFFAVADGLEAVIEIAEEVEKLFGLLIEEDVLVGAKAVDEAITAGCIFAFGGAGAGGLFRILAIGIQDRKSTR